jgi:BirA family biotin operon repressor/biotin-[acetyl-CoA-carboxylase] ligase
MKKTAPTLIEISSILSDGLYHDGETIGKKLDITRAGVWKAIKKLEDYDVKINSIKGKGYAISEPLFLLNETEVQNGIANKKIQIDVFENIDSTNYYLKNFIGAYSPQICIAEYQTKGKGRLNRSWYSPFGKNIYLSLLFPFQKDLSNLIGLSIVVGLAIIKALEYLGLDKELSIKWPNDIIFDSKKLAGTLIEVFSEANGLAYAIIGIGLNVNMTKDKKQITQPWISLKQILNQNLNRNKLCISLINNLLIYLNKFDEKGLAYFLAEWNSRDCLINKKVKLINANKTITGIARGINELGNLMLEIEKGHIKPFSAGDTSIVKD